MTERSRGSSSFHSMGKGGSYPIGIFRPCSTGSEGVFKRDFGARKVLGIALGILFKRSEPLHNALEIRFKVACQSRHLLLNGSFSQLIYGHAKSLRCPLETAASFRIPEMEHHTVGRLFRHDPEPRNRQQTIPFERALRDECRVVAHESLL